MPSQWETPSLISWEQTLNQPCNCLDMIQCMCIPTYWITGKYFQVTEEYGSRNCYPLKNQYNNSQDENKYTPVPYSVESEDPRQTTSPKLFAFPTVFDLAISLGVLVERNTSLGSGLFSYPFLDLPRYSETIYNDHLMGYVSAFWSSCRWPRATWMSSRRQKLLARVNWYIQSSLKHITE